MALYYLRVVASFSRQKLVLLALAIFAVVTVQVNISHANLTEMVKLVPADGEYADLFGSCVSISGDYAIVGAPNDDEGIIKNSGCAYIFERTKGIWSEKAKLLAPDRSLNDIFGSSVSISGDYAIVGKPWDDHTGSNYGSAYIFHRTEPIPGTIIWSQVAKLVALTEGGASDGGANDFFGTSVSISGDYAIVGAFNDDDNGTDSGSAYIYQRFGSTWSQVAKLLAPDGAAGDFFGYSVAISGDDAVVGAPRGDNSIGTDAGSIYFFKRSADTWSASPLTASGADDAGDESGWSVSIDGPFAVVGNHFYDGGESLANSGSARIFEEVNDSGIWGTLSRHWLEPSDGAASDEFGFAVGISGDYAVIGSLKYITGTGSAYIFQKNPADDAWLQFVKLIASGNPWGFGSAVSISGRYAIVGAKHDINTAGSAYIFDILSDPVSLPSGAMPGIPILLLDK